MLYDRYVVQMHKVYGLALLLIVLMSQNITSASTLNPSREVIVASSNFPSIHLLREAVDLDGRTLIAKGLTKDIANCAVVFDRHLGGPDHWNPQATLTLPENNHITDISICGDTAVLSSTLDDTYGIDAGSVHIFYRNHPSANEWGLWKSFGSPSIAATNRFGWKVDLDGELLAVSSGNDDAVYLFGRNAGGADQWGKIKHITPGQLEEASVRIHNNLLVVGSSTDETTYLYEQNSGGADNWGQVAQLTPSDNPTNLFGFSVAIWGETVVVGAYGDDDGGNYAGAAYIYSRNTGGADNWGEVTKIIASDAVAGQNLGRTVDIWNDTIMLSADGDTESTLGGAAYIFARNKGGADNWGQSAKLTSLSAESLSTPLFRGVAIGSDLGAASVNEIFSNSNKVNGVRIFQEYPCHKWDNFESSVILTDSNSAPLSDFGTAVSLYGDTLAVGSGSSTNADGLAYIYERNQGGKDAWGQISVNQAFSPGDKFGASLSLDGDTLAVGAPNGFDPDYAQGRTGYVRIFERNAAGPNTWGSQAHLVPTNGTPGDLYGQAVELDRDWIFVGAPSDNTTGQNSGAVYIHHRNKNGLNGWGIVQILTPTNTTAFMNFGGAVSADNGHLAIGDEYEVNSGNLAQGSVHIAEQNAGGSNQWNIVHSIRIPKPDAIGYTHFGSSVSLDGDTLAVGAPQYDNPLPDAGAVYIFERNRGGDGEWGQVKLLLPGNSLASTVGQFGASISLFEDLLCVGMPYTTNDTLFIYGRNEGGENNWGLLSTYDGSLGNNNRVGFSVSLFGRRIAMGEPHKVLGRVHILDPACNRVTTHDDIVAADGKTSLREAIDLANACTNDEITIYLADGDYHLSLAGSNENANATGDLDITNTTCTITIQGQGARNTRILSDGTDRIFHINGTVKLRDLTLTDGRTPDGLPGAGGANGLPAQGGGAILNYGDLTIDHCTISMNSAGRGGAAQSGQGTAGGNGGNGGAIFNTGTLNVFASTFNRNTAGHAGAGDIPGIAGDGGGIYNGTGGDLLVINSTFYQNFTGDGNVVSTVDGNGGGIYSGAGASSIKLRSNTFFENRAGDAPFVSGQGGGIYSGITIDPFNYNILEQNLGGSSPDGFATAQDPSYNVISDMTGLTLSGSAISNRNSLALCTALANHLGPTDTCKPINISPAIDLIPASLGGIRDVDQRGVSRPTNGVSVDAGAVEVLAAADFDGDGYSDAYEQAYNMDPESATYLGEDPDNDGAPSGDEYIAFTDWNDSFSVLQITQIEKQTNSFAITFSSSTNREYALQSVVDPVSGIWENVIGQSGIVGTSEAITLTDTNATLRKLYRIKVRIP